MAGTLLDTNHLSEALHPVSRVRDRIGQLCQTGVRVGTCVRASVRSPWDKQQPFGHLAHPLGDP
jgi:hypothetical protein